MELDAYDAALPVDGGRQATVVWSGELDMGAAPVASVIIRTAVTADQARSVVVDVSELTFIDAAGAGAIIAARQMLIDHNGDQATFRFDGATGVVAAVLTLL
jgi:anti-anti-sigma factor